MDLCPHCNKQIKLLNFRPGCFCKYDTNAIREVANEQARLGIDRELHYWEYSQQLQLFSNGKYKNLIAKYENLYGKKPEGYQSESHNQTRYKQTRREPKRHTGYSEQEEMEIISQQKKFQNELESDSEYQKAKDLDAAVTPPTDAVEYLNWLKTKRTDQPNFENKFKEKYLPEALKEYRLEKLQIEQRFEKGNTKPTTEPFPQITPYRCYECEKLMAVVEGKHRQFLGCTGFPDCKYRMRLSQDGKSAIPFKTNYDKTSCYDKTSDYNCDKCNKPMVIKESRRAKFLGCSGFPKCRNIMPLPDDLI